MKNLPDLMSEIKREYDKDPYNWRVLRGKDPSNHTNTFISHEDKRLWQIKTELKNPVTPIGFGQCVKRNLNDEISELMNTGTDLPIHEIYPGKENLIIALGLGKYSKNSTNKIRDILLQDIPDYHKRIELEINSEFQKLLKKEQLFNHYI